MFYGFKTVSLAEELPHLSVATLRNCVFVLGFLFLVFAFWFVHYALMHFTVDKMGVPCLCCTLLACFNSKSNYNYDIMFEYVPI